MNKKLLLRLFIFLIICLQISMAGEKFHSDQILYLQLRYNSDGITIINSGITDGKLKELRANIVNREILYEVISEDNEILAVGSIDNPLIKRFEYENPNNPGELIPKVVEVKSADFSLRINNNNRAAKINFYKSEFGAELKSSGNPEKLIASVSLISLEGREND